MSVKDWTGNAKSAFTCNGASSHSETDREVNDFYATEPKALELLLDMEQFDPFVWECACGQGHLSEVLRERGYIVKSSDLVDRGYGQGDIDFLQCTDKHNGDIITNPPYKYAQQFVEHALDIIPEGKRVAMFLKLTFLESKARRALFEKSPPQYIYTYHQTDCDAPWVEILKRARKTGRQLLMLGSYGKRVSLASRE